MSEPTPLSTLKLSQKGWILVSVPLIASFIFVGVLYFLLELADREVAQESHAREAAQLSGQLGKNVFDATQAVAAYSLTKNPAMSERYDRLAGEAPNLYEEMHHLMHGDAKIAHIIDSIEIVHMRALKLLKLARDAADEGDVDAIHLRHLREHLQSCLEEVMRKMHLLAEEIHRQQTGIHGDSAVTKQNVRWLLGLGLLVNVLISLSLANYFSRGIAQRLAVVNENARRFTRKAVLHPLLGGNDEISDVDRTFHSMVVALEAAEAERDAVEELKREFVAMVSHDLRTPLTSLQGTLALLQRGAFGDLSDAGKTILDKSEREMARLIRLIGDLLSLEKLHAGKFELALAPAKLEQVIVGAVDTVKRIGDDRGITITHEPTDVVVECDEARIIQVLVNLLGNALKFSPVQSEIKIVVERLDESIKVSVIDQGRGVPEDLRAAIFEKYKQVRTEDSTRHHGTGLGLTICKAIVEQHSGRIGVEANPSGGSAFWFTLPSAARAIDHYSAD